MTVTAAQIAAIRATAMAVVGMIDALVPDVPAPPPPPVDPLLIADDSRYLAFPLVRRLPDGRLLLVHQRGDTHNEDNTSLIVGRIGTETAGVVAWGAEFTVYDHPSQAAICVGLAVLDTGRVVLSFSRRAYPGNPTDGAFICYSDDVVSAGAAATWSAPVNVNSSLTGYTYMSGSVCQLANGDCLITVEGINIGDTYSRMRILRSTDRCLTWGNEVELDASQIRPYYEGQLLRLDDASLLLMLRTGSADGNIHRSRSFDSGATLSTPMPVFAGHGQPNTVQLFSGLLVCITRQNGSGDMIARVSADRGDTWAPEVVLDGTMTQMEYGCPVEMLDGRVLVVYGHQPTTSISNSDIRQLIFTPVAASPAPPPPPAGETVPWANVKLLVGGSAGAAAMFTDRSAHAHAATLIGDPAATDAVLCFGNPVAQFDGNDAASFGTAPFWKFLHDGSPWTVDAQFDMAAVGSSPVIVDTTNGTSSHAGLSIFIDINGRVRVLITRKVAASFAVNFTGTIDVRGPGLKHLRVSYDPTLPVDNLKVTVGGVTERANWTGMSHEPGNPYGPVCWAATSGGGQFATGYQTELRICNVALQPGVAQAAPWPQT